jgi:hypothetical protein
MVAFDETDQVRCVEYLTAGRLDGAFLLSPHDQQPLPRLLRTVSGLSARAEPGDLGFGLARAGCRLPTRRHKWAVPP